MIELTMKIKVEQEEFKRCIAAALQYRFGEETPLDQIKDFEVGDVVIPSDVETLLIGSSLGELFVKNEKSITMKRTE